MIAVLDFTTIGHISLNVCHCNLYTFINITKKRNDQIFFGFSNNNLFRQLLIKNNDIQLHVHVGSGCDPTNFPHNPCN